MAKRARERQKAPRRQPPRQRRSASRSPSRNTATLVWLALVGLVVGGGLLLMIAIGDDGARSDGAGALTGGDFHSLVVDPDDPERIFAGGHTVVSVSEDGGRTWREVPSLRDADAMGWAFMGDAIYVSGHPGLNRSTDRGQTFRRVNEGLPHTDVHAFGGDAAVLYGAGPGVGMFASTDVLGAWEVRTDEVGQSFFGRILVDPNDDEHLLAADAAAGVAESSDGGRSWRLVDSGLEAATWISRGGDGMELLVASGPVGAAASRDGGTSWEALELPDGVSLVEAVPGDRELLYAGRHSGDGVQVYVSRDGGSTWAATTRL